MTFYVKYIKIYIDIEIGDEKNLDKKSLEKILKAKIVSEKYNEAIDILCNEIEKIYIKRIKKYNSNFKFITPVELADSVEEYLTDKEVRIFSSYYIAINEDDNKLYKIDLLVHIYNELIKCGGENI